uniref:Uncharacterized protein n=1 Tax=Anguilla anguilla TaxID=7936 RepID=A0A0E9VCZ2_ANGAN
MRRWNDSGIRPWRGSSSPRPSSSLFWALSCSLCPSSACCLPSETTCSS